MTVTLKKEIAKKEISLSQAKEKEFFHNKNITLIQGDALQRNLFDTEFIDLIVTSPPYNLGIDFLYNSSDRFS